MAKTHFGATTYLYPMPALLVVVKTGPNTANALTIAWGGIASGNPPTLSLGIGSMHYSSRFIESVGDFTVNIPRSSQAAGVDYCGSVSGRDDPEKIMTCGWTLSPAAHIQTPYIEECPINFECQLVDIIHRETNATYLGKIVATHIDSDIVQDKGAPQAPLLDPLFWTPDGSYYRIGEQIGKEYVLGKSVRRST